MDWVTLPVWRPFTSTAQRALFLLNQFLQTWWDHTRSYPVADCLWNLLKGWMPFNRTKHSGCGLESPTSVMGTTEFCELRCVADIHTSLTTDCDIELGPIFLSASLNSGAYLGKFVIVFGFSSNTNVFGITCTYVNSSWGRSDSFFWPLGHLPAHMWDTHMNKNAS